jgi:hypothetical protein
MYSTAKALKTFFSGFDLPAYAVNSVPESVSLPYITYPLTEPEWDEQATFYCQVWYPKKHLTALLSKADQIVAAIGMGAKFDLGEGYLVLYPSTPLIQILTDDDTQRAYINLIIKAYHTPGI